MGDSVLLPQIRNLKNVSDLRRKQRQQRQALQTGIKVDRDAEDSFKLAAQQIKQNMLPLMPNELMLQNAADDKVAQYNTALDHLKSIMPAVYATQVMQQGILGDDVGISEFNRHWPGFQKYAANVTNLTPSYFMTYWQKYRKLLQATDKTGFYGESGILDNIPTATAAPVPATVVYGPRNKRNTTSLPDTPPVIIPRYKVLPYSPTPKWYENPMSQPTTESLVAKPQSTTKSVGYRADWIARPSEYKKGAPILLMEELAKGKEFLQEKDRAVKRAIANYLKPSPAKLRSTWGFTSTEDKPPAPPGVQEVADKISPFMSQLDITAEQISVVALALSAYTLLYTDINPIELATQFVNENADAAWTTIKQKGFQLMLRMVAGPDVQEGYLDWFQALQQQFAPQQGGTVHRKGNAKIIGFGLTMDDECRYRQFGRYLIHMPSLQKNLLNVKFPSFASHPKMPQRVVSDELVALITKILETGQMNAPLYAALSESDKEYFDTLAHTCKVGGKLGIERKEDTEDMKRFQIVRGEILSGNDAPQLIKELKLLTLKLVTEGKIPKRSAHDLLIEISLL